MAVDKNVGGFKIAVNNLLGYPRRQVVHPNQNGTQDLGFLIIGQSCPVDIVRKVTYVHVFEQHEHNLLGSGYPCSEELADFGMDTFGQNVNLPLDQFHVVVINYDLFDTHHLMFSPECRIDPHPLVFANRLDVFHILLVDEPFQVHVEHCVKMPAQTM